MFRRPSKETCRWQNGAAARRRARTEVPRRNFAWLLPLLLCLAHAEALAAEATVVLVTTDCQDYFVVDTGGQRYALLEWYGGARPEKGEVLGGDFAHFGVQDMQLMPGARRVRVWLEDYDLSQDDINDWLADKCQ